jgi:hypothetical protein
MKIYIGHSNGFDFKNELYIPIKQSNLNNEHTFFLPHEKSLELFPSLEYFKTKQVDIFIAETSYPSTGLGIELGWASSYTIPIVCIYKKGQKYSSSISAVTDKIIEYTNDNLVEVLGSIINAR